MKNNFRYRITDNTVEVYINHKGDIVTILIDQDDLEIVNSYKDTWTINGGYATGYVKVTSGRKGKRRTIRMHRLIMEAPEGLEVDHINRNPYDNRRSNLRLVTQQENAQNKGLYKNSTTGKTGISFKKSLQKWRAYKYKNGKQIHLGYFTNIEEAEKALADGS